MIDAGFDLVVGTHPHVLNPEEIYRGKLIAYSLGNFLSAFRPLEARTGAVLEVDIGVSQGRKAELLGFRYRPVITEHADGSDADYRVAPVSDGHRGDQGQALQFARSIVGAAAVSVGPTTKLALTGPSAFSAAR